MTTELDNARAALNAVWPRTGITLPFGNAIRAYMNAAEAEIERLTAPPTEDEVEAALHGYHGTAPGQGFVWREDQVPAMRSALEAAKKAR